VDSAAVHALPCASNPHHVSCGSDPATNMTREQAAKWRRDGTSSHLVLPLQGTGMQDQHLSATASLAPATPSASKGHSCRVPNREATSHDLEAPRILGPHECEPWALGIRTLRSCVCWCRQDRGSDVKGSYQREGGSKGVVSIDALV
jgi:hypothetical protein